MCTFPALFPFAFVHAATRLVLGNFVYALSDFTLLQTIEGNLISGCALTPKIIIVVGPVAALEVMAWNGSKYIALGRGILS